MGPRYNNFGRASAGDEGMSVLDRWFGQPKKEAAAAAPPPPAPVEKKAERGTSTRKKPTETSRKTKTRLKDDEAYLKRGLERQQAGDHAGAVEDFTKAIEMNGSCFRAYEGRGVSRERTGDTAGAKSDYMTSISIQVNAELNRQMRENPDVSV